MQDTVQLLKDCELLQIDGIENPTFKYVTAKYKSMAKQKHPDKPGGTKVEFQDLQNAYKRIIKYIEETSDCEDDFEKEFFMINNATKECTASVCV